MYIFLTVWKMIIQKWKRYLFFILIAVFVAAIGTISASSLLYSGKLTDPLNVIIVNEDTSKEANIFLSILEDIETYKDIIEFSYTDEAEAIKLLEENKAAAAFIIPQAFVDDVKSGINRPFYVVVNGKKPISQKLIEYFAYAFTDLLAASQGGVYAALDYTIETAPEKYNSMFYAVNIKFLDLALNRESMIRESQVSVISETSIQKYYILSFWIFFNFTAMLLFFDILSDNFNGQIRKYLKAENVSFVLIALSMCLAIFFVLILINMFMFGFVKLIFNIAIDIKALPLILLILFLVSALTVFISSLIKSASSACIFVSLITLFDFFISGGIIPTDFFAESLRSLSEFSIQYICREGLLNSGEGKLYILFIASLVMLAASAKLYKGVRLK